MTNQHDEALIAEAVRRATEEAPPYTELPVAAARHAVALARDPNWPPPSLEDRFLAVAREIAATRDPDLANSIRRGDWDTDISVQSPLAGLRRGYEMAEGDWG